MHKVDHFHIEELFSFVRWQNLHLLRQNFNEKCLHSEIECEKIFHSHREIRNANSVIERLISMPCWLLFVLLIWQEGFNRFAVEFQMNLEPLTHSERKPTIESTSSQSFLHCSIRQWCGYLRWFVFDPKNAPCEKWMQNVKAAQLIHFESINWVNI